MRSLRLDGIKILIVLILSLSSPVYAQSIITYGTTVNTFNGFANATGNGFYFAVPQRTIGFVTWCTSFGTAPSSATINLQISNDNSTYATIDTHSSTTATCRTLFLSSKFIRGNISAISGGTTTTVNINILPTGSGNNLLTAGVLTKLPFGGTTSAFPMLKRNGINLQVRQADDSGFATIEAYTLISQGSDGGIQLSANAGAATNAGVNAIRLYIREDVSTTGTATADCNLIARINSGVEVVVSTLVTDGGCP